MRAVHLTAFGNPVDGLEFVDIPEPDAPGANQVLTGVEFSPINPNDLMVARGIYAIRPAHQGGADPQPAPPRRRLADDPPTDQAGRDQDPDRLPYYLGK